MDLIIEPMAELVLSPNTNTNPKIPNEDSQALYLDETNVMRVDPYPGYDLYAGGPRASVGAMATLDWGASHDAKLFVGRDWRTSVPYTIPLQPGQTQSQANVLAAQQGLINDKYSDWVVYESVSPLDGLNAWSRQRFDGDTGNILRTEAAVNWNVGWTQGIVRYLFDDTNLLDLIDPSFVAPLPPPGRREEAEAAGFVMVTKHWGAVFDAIRDLREDIWRRGEAGILYRDECVDVEVVYQRNETNPLGPSSTTLLRLNFPMTGSLGFLNYENR
jgi:LPS-assembly protein